MPLSACLLNLHKGIVDLIVRTQPGAVAIEGVFFSRNVKTSVTLGEARGVVIAACAAAGMPVYEYSPRRVKQALVGFGAAEKDQVRKMVMSILNLSESPVEDAGDALALAICHLHSKAGYAAVHVNELNAGQRRRRLGNIDKGEQLARSITFLICRKIRLKGQKPHWFVKNSMDELSRQAREEVAPRTRSRQGVAAHLP